MRMKKLLPLVVAAAFAGCIDSLPSAGNEVDLNLTQVDGKPLPIRSESSPPARRRPS